MSSASYSAGGATEHATRSSPGATEHSDPEQYADNVDEVQEYDPCYNDRCYKKSTDTASMIGATEHGRGEGKAADVDAQHEKPQLVVDCITGCLVLNEETKARIHEGTTIQDWIDAADKSQVVFAASPKDQSRAGEPGAEVVRSLQPIGSLIEGADPADARNWRVHPDNLGELLGRTREGKDAFPFAWYRSLESSERVEWTLGDCEISLHLKDSGITVTTNIQNCDAAAVSEALGDTYAAVPAELSEYGAGEDGKINTEDLDASVVTTEGLSLLPRDVWLDDVGDKKRTFENVLDVLAEDAIRGEGKIRGIKIDIKPATRAFHGKVIYPPSDLCPDDANMAAVDLDKFVRAARHIKPSLKFVVECSVLEDSKLRRVPALYRMPGVSFQACHLARGTGARAIPVMLPRHK